jgi:hypothetical protein
VDVIEEGGECPAAAEHINAADGFQNEDGSNDRERDEDAKTGFERVFHIFF